MPTVAEIGETFRGVDREMRIQILLDYARKLPPLPRRLHAERDRGGARVHECTTPLWLWIEPGEDDTLHLFIDVAEEAPTIRGIAGILVSALDGAPRAAYAELPTDLVTALGLEDVLRMNRRVGVAALVSRIRRGAA
jgi:cysteine desulfuration protein SufE